MLLLVSVITLILSPEGLSEPLSSMPFFPSLITFFKIGRGSLSGDSEVLLIRDNQAWRAHLVWYREYSFELLELMVLNLSSEIQQDFQ